MQINLKKYEEDLERLIEQGNSLKLSLQTECFPNEITEQTRLEFAYEADEMPETYSIFAEEYQEWYSEAQIVIKQLLPDRLSDFTQYYKKTRSENYCINDYLQGLTVDKIGDQSREQAIPLFRQQLSILKSASARFNSSLFSLKRIVQADLFDSELDAGRELMKNGFLRPAGTIAGVILEKHLAEVAANYNVKPKKDKSTIAVFNDLLKDKEIIDVPQWRKIQGFGDIRNLCCHNKQKAPTKDQVLELINGVENLTKNLF